ncbi:tripartite tricarboxylate transporter substrate binding protein [Pigmentiphaga litoralis]|jgi:tripartite-type tricarboxylate transporter receptor subunit TctC|uniref:tripartite tricarboxylate transporter substrate binding protein n=1 Tax=Pigmentiphaga litoralis TaxID=516702 RepID=UPI001679336B|nr:tripartite tricarboxylate transporter substrate binding protein [Pigmentiphaga litoralis]
MMKRRALASFAKLALAVAACSVAVVAAAQSPSPPSQAPQSPQVQPPWPTKPVRIIVPYAPGGGSDTLGRLVSRRLSEVFKQTFVVENRSGVAGVIGSQMVAKADPDGYTLVVSGIGSHVVAPMVNDNTFDPIKDFTHIAFLGGPPTVLVVGPDSPYKDLKGFVEYAKANPGKISWGSPGQGTHGYMIGDAFASTAGIKMVTINYKGGNPAMTDLLAGHVNAAFMSFGTTTPYIQSGKLRALAITSDKRADDFPQLPTFTEQGYPALTGTTWFSLSGPAGMPPAIVERLNTEVRRALRSPEIVAEMRRQNMETLDMDVPTFNAYVRSEIQHWKPYVSPAQADAKP